MGINALCKPHNLVDLLCTTLYSGETRFSILRRQSWNAVSTVLPCLSVVGNAELHERRDCVSMKLSISNVPWHHGSDEAIGCRQGNCGRRQQFYTVIFHINCLPHDLLRLNCICFYLFVKGLLNP